MYTEEQIGGKVEKGGANARFLTFLGKIEIFAPILVLFNEKSCYWPKIRKKVI